MSIKTALSAVILLSATTLPALAEDFSHDPARPYASALPGQRPLFGGIVAEKSAMRKAASNAANAVTMSDAKAGSSVPAFSTDPHMYDYLSGPEYRGGA